MSPSSNSKLVRFLIFALLSQTVSSFNNFVSKQRKCSYLAMHETGDKPRISNSFVGNNDILGRISKVAVSTLCSVALCASLTSANIAPAFADSANSGPVTVLGSNGKTGKMIVQYLSSKGVAVRPTSYRESSKNPFEGLAGVEAPAIGDVTKIETLEPVIKGSKAVIFAASASNKGGKADKVDYEGVINVANECVRLKVPRLVVISSGAVTRPDSLGFKITNLFGGIMEYKLKGELGLKAAYANADPSVSYVIIRPGGLLDSVAVGPGHVELNQGDSISGEVNREDVAQAAGAAAISTTMPKAVTFEMNEAGRSAPLEGKFAKVSGYERNGEKLGADYNTLFEGLKSGNVVVEAEKK
jgi:NAD(P)H-binding